MQYFPDMEYAQEVFKEIFRLLKSGGCVSIMDICDAEKQKGYHDFRRANSDNPTEYDEKYNNLRHAFYSKIWVTDCLEAVGFECVELFDHSVEEYLNGQFRFNVFMRKA